jgi:50S ribosomal protein L16 3-hydroxylase
MQLNLGCSAEDFLNEFWQKKSRLIRQALPNFKSSVTPEELAGLACEAGVEARIIQGQGKQFSLAQGPFTESFFKTLPEKNWTLLVQSVDQWDPEIAALLACFSFLPRWRIEDIMISYAAKGGSVGAHVDQYDVFLLQASGKRRWKIDAGEKTGIERRYVARSQVKLLQRFEATESFDLEPGDMLYLPPGVGHHGIALDSDCMTFSIGLRAPSLTEMLMDFAAERAEMLPDSLRYADPDLTARADPNAIVHVDIARARALMQQALALDTDQFASWFGRFTTRYRSEPLPPQRSKKSRLVDAFLLANERTSTRLEPNSRFRWAYAANGLYVGGKQVAVPEKIAAKLLRSGLSLKEFSALSSSSRAELEQLYRSGAVVFSSKNA